MKTQFQLYMDMIRTNARASELERLADELKKLANNRIQNKLSQLSRDWTGSASAEYIRQGKALSASIQKQADSLLNKAQTIRRIAKRTYDTEMRALELAQNRTYH